MSKPKPKDKASNETYLLSGLVLTLSKEAEDCLLLTLHVSWPSQLTAERLCVVYRREGVVRIIPDPVGGGQPIKEIREQHSLFNKIEIPGVLEEILEMPVKIVKIEALPIDDKRVVTLLRRLPKEQQTGVKE